MWLMLFEDEALNVAQARAISIVGGAATVIGAGVGAVVQFDFGGGDVRNVSCGTYTGCITFKTALMRHLAAGTRVVRVEDVRQILKEQDHG